MLLFQLTLFLQHMLLNFTIMYFSLKNRFKALLFKELKKELKAFTFSQVHSHENCIAFSRFFFYLKIVSEPFLQLFLQYSCSYCRFLFIEKDCRKEKLSYMIADIKDNFFVQLLTVELLLYLFHKKKNVKCYLFSFCICTFINDNLKRQFIF